MYATRNLEIYSYGCGLDTARHQGILIWPYTGSYIVCNGHHSSPLLNETGEQNKWNDKFPSRLSVVRGEVIRYADHERW